ncbi:hypothetical protein BU24DRAFT_427703 [Aaosphaeria arxii CBS 175.79]|uniref:Protein kinase domain-containing protein n=1 Tax=Aaosphaeria arxii CBS 175.79 TaxID=1450172 RepID=A0A6A5XBW7_9PLEO|nr:uncharacterized protein BU24DRAFT_427703 [Aaosphaeria arxii CBS 175.79]KAF2010585.1 hypothetical protein BU24DRAFT_427703 [Aaosphaeria arxii CBS 175.79]
MGDGAFSNVYRAKDNTGQWGEVAIKVVRKFEMNSSQVCIAQTENHLHSPIHCINISLPFLPSPLIRRNRGWCIWILPTQCLV